MDQNYSLSLSKNKKIKILVKSFLFFAFRQLQYMTNPVARTFPLLNF